MSVKSDFFDTSIDKMDLDNEILRNGEALKYWYKRITVLTEERDTLKKQIKDRESKLILQATKNPKSLNLEKATKDSIDAAVHLDTEVNNAESDLIAVNKELSEAYNFRDLFKDRNDSISRLITLYLNNYYSGVREDKNFQKASEYSDSKIKNKAQNDIEEALKKRKNKKR